MRYHLRLHTTAGNYLVVFRRFVPTLRGASRMLYQNPSTRTLKCVRVEVVT